MRKLFYFILLVFVPTVFSACLRSATSDYSPDIRLYDALNNRTDTLAFKWSASGNYYVMDTVAVGDSVRLGFTFCSYSNNLTSLHVLWDDALADMCFAPMDTLTKYFDPSSDFAHGNFVLPNKGYSIANIMCTYVPKVVSNSALLTIRVVSDSKYSTTSVQIKTPIR